MQLHPLKLCLRDPNAESMEKAFGLATTKCQEIDIKIEKKLNQISKKKATRNDKRFSEMKWRIQKGNVWMPGSGYHSVIFSDFNQKESFEVVTKME